MSHLAFFREEGKKLINLKEASIWASQYLNRKISVSNISYLIQYGRIKKYGNNGNILINLEELKNYYDSFIKERKWRNILGEDIN